MKFLTTLTATLLLATLAHAAPATDHQSMERLEVSPLVYLNAFQAPTMPQACTDANFTPDQQTAMRNEMYQADRRNVTLKANLKLAMMEYHHVISDAARPIADAQAAATPISTSVAALVTNKTDLINTVLYTILTPEQRTASIECFMELEKREMEKKLTKICAGMPKPKP